MSIGNRSQSARTYLEKHLNKFIECNEEDLVKHGLYALKETLSSEEIPTEKNISIAVVNKEGFRILKEDEVKEYIKKTDDTNIAGASASAEE